MPPTISIERSHLDPRIVERPRRSVRSGRRSRRISIAAVLAAVLISVFGPGLRPSPAAADGVPITPGLPDTTFYGRGYGHGVGMSQYGARGRALAGQLAPEILAHYYAGTTLGTRSTTTVVRVLLLSGLAATTVKPLTVIGRIGTWTIDGIGTVFPIDARLTLVPTAVGATTWRLRVVSATGATLQASIVSGDVYVRPTTGSGYLELASKTGPMNLYRGFLRLHLTKTATVINHVSIERYLRGVVTLEMPASWPGEALKAQAIASRSYALVRVHPTGLFDVYDDTRSQVYRGRRAETVAGNTAITATAGVVLLNGTSLANALYHSADGGWTENNENAFVSSTGATVAGPVPYLRGSSDRAPDGSSYDRASPWATWATATYSGAQLSAFFATDPRTDVGAISSLDLSHRGVSGRLISVTLTGDLGTKTVSGEVFRSVFNRASPLADPAIRSTLFDLAPIP